LNTVIQWIDIEGVEMVELVLVSLLTIFFTWSSVVNMRRAREFEEVKAQDLNLGRNYFVSIIVPMRNEERNVERCIGSLVNQDYPNYEIIAVDDMSTDGTLRILEVLSAKYPSLKVLTGSPTPQGWVGKNHALWQGVQKAGGDWLLFVDADTYSEPYTLRLALSYAEERKADMLSIFPFQELGSFWERIIQPIIFAAIASSFPHKRVNSPNYKEAAANGQFILIRRDVYQAVGGHETIKDKIVEDFALAKLIKGKGYRLWVARGRHLIRTRMYRNLKEIWEGWTKNIFLGVDKNWRRLIIGIIMLFLRGFLPFILIIQSLLAISSSAGSHIQVIIFLEGLWLVFLNTYLSWEGTKAYAIPDYYAILFPISMAAFIGIAISSTYKIVSGKGVVWKGRRYEGAEDGN
jgi:chlorobactene glucosyltransferase